MYKRQGEYQKNGIPGYLLTRFLDDRRIELARTGDYTVLILFSVGITKGKWGTLIESLLALDVYKRQSQLSVRSRLFTSQPLNVGA